MITNMNAVYVYMQCYGYILEDVAKLPPCVARVDLE